MRLRQIVLVLALLGVPATAQAQILDIMDWIERMSGPALPGAFWVDLPLVCRYTDDLDLLASLAERDVVSPSVSSGGKPRAVPKPRGRYPAIDDIGDRGSQLRQDGLGRRLFPPRRKNLLPCSPVLLGYRDAQSTDVEAAFRRSLVFSLRLASYNANHDGDGLFWGDNNLKYDLSIPDGDQTMHTFAFGPSISFAVHPKIDLVWALELNRFYGKSFESFWIPSVDAIGLSYRPFDRENTKRILRFLQANLRVKWYLGTIEDVDFGAAPGTFESKFESVLMLGVSYDLSRLIWPRR